MTDRFTGIRPFGHFSHRNGVCIVSVGGSRHAANTGVNGSLGTEYQGLHLKYAAATDAFKNRR